MPLPLGEIWPLTHKSVVLALTPPGQSRQITIFQQQYCSQALGDSALNTTICWTLLDTPASALPSPADSLFIVAFPAWSKGHVCAALLQLYQSQFPSSCQQLLRQEHTHTPLQGNALGHCTQLQVTVLISGNICMNCGCDFSLIYMPYMHAHIYIYTYTCAYTHILKWLSKS